MVESIIPMNVWRVVVERLRHGTQALVFLISSVGSSPGCDTCVLEQDIVSQLLCPLDGTLSRRSHVLGLVVHIKEPRTLIM